MEGQSLLKWRTRVSTFKRDPSHILEYLFASYTVVIQDSIAIQETDLFISEVLLQPLYLSTHNGK